MNGKSPELDPRLSALEDMECDYLEGRDAQQWRVEIVKGAPERMTRSLPEGALLFTDNGYGDHLVLKPGDGRVFVFRHEGGEIEEYAASVAELRPDLPRSRSDHPPITYRGSEEVVRLGDRVRMRYWLVLGGQGEVVYVPGVSPHKPSMERDGLAWVGVRLDDGARVDTIVMLDGSLKKSVTLLARHSSR